MIRNLPCDCESDLESLQGADALEFSGKVALITGSSSGIGKATAIHLANQGANVVLTGREKCRVCDTAQKCTFPERPKPLALIGELTDENYLKDLIEKTIKYFGKLDILVNNAGIFEQNNIENLTMEQYDNIMDVNLRSVVQLTNLAVPYLKKTQGNIVNVSSVSAASTFPGNIAYSISKVGINKFTQCAAAELAQYKIRVNAVLPGITQTNIFRNAGMCERKLKNFFDTVKDSYPLKRIADTQDIANAIAFLASEKSSFVTGVLLPIDGGKSSCVI